MAEKIVSAGVFTRERDLSFISQGVSEIGAAIIGPTQKGPALVPVTVNTITEFYTKLGYSSLKTYVPRTVEDYLKSAGTVTVVRVLGGSAYQTWYSAIIPSTGTAAAAYAVLAPTINSGVSYIASMSANASASSAFVLNVGASAYSCSLDSTSPNYITKVFGTSPNGQRELYVVHNFPNYTSESYNASADLMVASGSISQTAGYDHGVTPWIQSQKISDRYYNLFKFHTLGDGWISNREVKVGIQDIKPGTAASDYYGSFTVVVRAVNGTFNSQDLDRRPEVLETFANVTLNPDSNNYVAKVIGDMWTLNTVVDGANRVITSGSYANNSSYVRIEMATGADALPPEAVPYGFQGPKTTFPSLTGVPSESLSSAIFRIAQSGEGAAQYPYVLTQSIDGAYDARRFYGWNYENDDTLPALYSVPSGVTITFASFSLDNVTVPSTLSGTPYAGSLTNVTGTVAQRKFLVPFQYGYDGMHPTASINVGGDITNTNVFGYDCSTATSTGTTQWKKAIDAVANAEDIDINLLVLPGLIHGVHTPVTTYAKNAAESRGDCFYIMDIAQYSDSVAQVINNVTTNELDSNYTAVYYPWVKVVESNSSKPFWVPPSVIMPGVYAFNDRVAYEWFAPAGLNRGGLTSVIEAKTKLTHGNRDDLYDARINPIATFPGQGVVAWGQKTLQIKASALDRVNVRRLLINLKKFIASTSRYLVFEQNTSATRNRFLNIVNPYLASVQQKSGLYAFKVVMDETNNTPDLIDRNIMYGQIYIQPTKTAEFIIVDFNILPTGATFPNA